jgi:hypothetical protein
MIELTKAQKIVATEYAGGEFSYFADMTWLQVRPALEDCGDTLFVFFMCEFADDEGCDSLGEAVDRMEKVLREVEEVQRALEKGLREEEADADGA